MCEFTAKDYKKGQPRWCPGCGDHFFLASLHKAMAEIGVAPWDIAVIFIIQKEREVIRYCHNLQHWILMYECNHNYPSK